MCLNHCLNQLLLFNCSFSFEEDILGQNAQVSKFLFACVIFFISTSFLNLFTWLIGRLKGYQIHICVKMHEGKAGLSPIQSWTFWAFHLSSHFSSLSLFQWKDYPIWLHCTWNTLCLNIFEFLLFWKGASKKRRGTNF